MCRRRAWMRVRVWYITKFFRVWASSWLRGAMVARSTPDRKVGGSIPSGVTWCFVGYFFGSSFWPKCSWQFSSPFGALSVLSRFNTHPWRSHPLTLTIAPDIIHAFSPQCAPGTAERAEDSHISLELGAAKFLYVGGDCCRISGCIFRRQVVSPITNLDLWAQAGVLRCWTALSIWARWQRHSVPEAASSSREIPYSKQDRSNATLACRHRLQHWQRKQFWTLAAAFWQYCGTRWISATRLLRRIKAAPMWLHHRTIYLQKCVFCLSPSIWKLLL